MAKRVGNTLAEFRTRLKLTLTWVGELAVAEVIFRRAKTSTLNGALGPAALLTTTGCTPSGASLLIGATTTCVALLLVRACGWPPSVSIAPARSVPQTKSAL